MDINEEVRPHTQPTCAWIWPTHHHDHDAVTPKWHEVVCPTCGEENVINILIPNHCSQCQELLEHKQHEDSGKL